MRLKDGGAPRCRVRPEVGGRREVSDLPVGSALAAAPLDRAASPRLSLVDGTWQEEVDELAQESASASRSAPLPEPLDAMEPDWESASAPREPLPARPLRAPTVR